MLAFAGEGGWSEVIEPLGEEGWDPDAEGDDGEEVLVCRG